VFTLSGFGDEISADLDEQLAALKSMGINYLELRGAWGKNVLDFDEAELKRTKQALDEQGMAISSIGSPIGKVAIEAPFQPHLEDFRRMLDVAQCLESPFLRIFSFYVPDGRQGEYRAEVMRRMEALVRAADEAPVTVLHENESLIYGDSPERTADILRTIDSPKLRACYDPSNWVQVGVSRPFERAWPLLGDYVIYVHVKDAIAETGEVVTAGMGDGQVRELLQALKARGGNYFLSLEPHLVFAGSSLGFSGADLFRQAADTLRELVATLV
jgi:sugar phosphate isomerase/epimerase